MSSIRRICVFPWESPSYCAKYAAAVQATASDAGVVSPSLSRSGTDSPALAPTTRSIPDPLGEIPFHLTQEQVDAAEKKLQAARDYATKVGVRGLGLAGVPQLALTVTYEDLIRGPFVHMSTPPSSEPEQHQQSSLDDPFNTPIWEVQEFEEQSIVSQAEELVSSPTSQGASPLANTFDDDKEQDDTVTAGFGLSMGGLSSSRTVTNLAQLAGAMGVKDGPAPFLSSSMSSLKTPPKGFPRKFSTQPVYSTAEWEAMHPNHHAHNHFRHAMLAQFPKWRAPRTDAAAQPFVSPIPEVYDEDEHDKFVTIDRPEWHIPLFVKHSIPDPLGEIPNWLDQNEVDNLEAKITELRQRAVRRGIPGLGIGGAGALELTYGIPMARLEEGCRPAKLGNCGHFTGAWGYRFPDLPRSPEVQQQTELSSGSFLSGVGDWFVDRARHFLTSVKSGTSLA